VESLGTRQQLRLIDAKTGPRFSECRFECRAVFWFSSGVQGLNRYGHIRCDRQKLKKTKKQSVIEVLLRNSDNIKSDKRLTIAREKNFWYGQETHIMFISCYDWP